MKTFISLSLLAFLSLGLTVACSSGSSGPTCDEVCAKMVECEIESNSAECLSMCAIFKDAWRDDVYAELGDCFMENTCEVLNQDEDLCFAQAEAKGSIAAAKALYEDLCAKWVECEDTWTQEQCVQEMEDDHSDGYLAIGMFTDSVLNCMSDCVDGLTCAEALDGPSMGDCAEGCNFLID